MSRFLRVHNWKKEIGYLGSKKLGQKGFWGLHRFIINKKKK